LGRVLAALVIAAALEAAAPDARVGRVEAGGAVVQHGAHLGAASLPHRGALRLAQTHPLPSHFARPVLAPHALDPRTTLAAQPLVLQTTALARCVLQQVRPDEKHKFMNKGSI